MKTDQTDKVSNPERQSQPEDMIGIYEISKEKRNVDKDVCWIPEYLKLAVEPLKLENKRKCHLTYQQVP